MIKETKQYLLFDDISNFKIMDIPISVNREFKKQIEIGDTYYIKDTMVKKLKSVLYISEHKKEDAIGEQSRM